MPVEPNVPAPFTLLVIGYGNPLRRDDGLGPRIALTIEQWGLPGVRVFTPHQLTPELADPISRADAVAFIDAAVDRVAGVQVRALSPAAPIQMRAHMSDPSVLLSLACAAFGKAPPAWWITVPASDLSFGEGLSDRAEAAMSDALEAFRQLWTQLALQTNCNSVSHLVPS